MRIVEYSVKVALAITHIISLNAFYTDAQRLELIKKYAPLVWLHPDEAYWPSSIEFDIAGSELRKQVGEKDEQVLPQGQVTIENIGNYPGREYFLKQVDSATKFGQKCVKSGACTVPVYVNFVPKPTGEIVIQYWFHYGFSGALSGLRLTRALDIGTHYGDWEHVVVFLNAEGTIEKMFYARHGQNKDGEIVAAKDIQFDNGHPIVWSALYGHGSHARNLKIIDTYNLDRTGSGFRWETWNNIVDMNNPAATWTKFQGRWGDNDNAPRTPTAQNTWLYPLNTVAKVLYIENVIGQKSSIIDWSNEIPTRVTEGQWTVLRGSRNGIPIDNICFNIYKSKKITKDEKIYDHVCSGQKRGIKKLREQIYIKDIEPASTGPLTFKLELIEV